MLRALVIKDRENDIPDGFDERHILAAAKRRSIIVAQGGRKYERITFFPPECDGPEALESLSEYLTERAVTHGRVEYIPSDDEEQESDLADEVERLTEELEQLKKRFADLEGQRKGTKRIPKVGEIWRDIDADECLILYVDEPCGSVKALCLHDFEDFNPYTNFDDYVEYVRNVRLEDLGIEEDVDHE